MKPGALFDWDGVIIDSSRQHEESWERLAKELGKILPEGHFKKGFGMKNQFIIPNYLGWATAPDEIEEIAQRKEALYRDIVCENGIDPLPGVVPLLKLLRDHEVPACVASSTPLKNIETIQDIIGVREYFCDIVSADDVSHGKPDPEVFQIAASRVGKPPAECIVFEDAHVGIEAADAAGCKIVAVATTNPLADLCKADLAVSSLEEINWPLLAGLFQ